MLKKKSVWQERPHPAENTGSKDYSISNRLAFVDSYDNGQNSCWAVAHKKSGNSFILVYNKEMLLTLRVVTAQGN